MFYAQLVAKFLQVIKLQPFRGQDKKLYRPNLGWWLLFGIIQILCYYLYQGQEESVKLEDSIVFSIDTIVIYLQFFYQQSFILQEENSQT